MIQSKSQYTFELQISKDENEKELFKIYYAELESAIRKLKSIIHIEWKTHYSSDVVRSITNQYHEGVLILASAKRLKEYYSSNIFNGKYPDGIKELLEKEIIIAIECGDHSFTTIVETERFSKVNKNLANTIVFHQDDKLLVLHHGQFSMICNHKNGDYAKYGFKDLIISVDIELPGDQEIIISRCGEEEDGELILQFNNIEIANDSNYLIQFQDIPKHNENTKQIIF